MRSDGHPPCAACGRVAAAEMIRQRLGTCRARLAELADPRELTMLRVGLQSQGPRALLALEAAAAVAALEALLRQIEDQPPPPMPRFFPGHLPEEDDDTDPSQVVIDLEID